MITNSFVFHSIPYNILLELPKGKRIQILPHASKPLRREIVFKHFCIENSFFFLFLLQVLLKILFKGI